jgi:hypothetical protein
VTLHNFVLYKIKQHRERGDEDGVKRLEDMLRYLMCVKVGNINENTRNL